MSIEINVINQIVQIDETSEVVQINTSGGIGVPSGGLTNQFLAKNSNTNYDFKWANVLWGQVSGTLSDQTDLQNALNNKVPYTGATGAVSLGLFGLTAGTLTLQEQPLNGSTYKLTQRMASNDYWSIYGFASVADYGDLYFELQDNAAFADGQRFRFHYGNDSSGTPKDILVMDYNSATIDGTMQVNTLAGTGTRMVISDANGALSTQAIPSTSSGGSSINYYLNGSVNSSVAGYKQLGNTATIGAGTDFTLSGNGLIAQFLTDAGNPNRLEISGGAWNFEMFFQVSSSGGNQKFYVELLKYDGTTFTSIASSSAIPEQITGGTAIDLYLTSLAVPTTTLLVTDRLAIRVYIVDNSGGRTITLHTEDNTLCEIITTFAGGISALNGLTANTQYFATGTSGTDFGINSVSDTHTFNLPTASATNRGALSSADWSTFNNKQAALTLTTTGTSGAATLVGATLNIPQYSGGGGSMAIGGAITSATAGSVLFAGTSGVLAQDNANLFWDDTNNRLGIGTATPTKALDVASDIVVNGLRIGKGNNSILENTAFGVNALNTITSGLRNTGIGYASLGLATSGSYNLGLGAYALYSLTTGSNNFALGATALWQITTSSNNIAIGTDSSYAMTSGSGNTSIGTEALKSNNTGSENLAIGYRALSLNGSGSFNIGIGAYALSPTTTSNNTGIGYGVLFNNTSGGNNTAIGFSAGRYISGGSTANVITNNSIYIGYQTKALASNQTNQIVIGYQETGLGSNTTIIGNSSTITTALRGRLILGTTSDSGLYQLDVNGTARVSGALTVTGSTTAASAIARGANYTPTLVAAANNDFLVGLDITPTYTLGAFSGVSRLALRATGNAIIKGGSITTDKALDVQNSVGASLFHVRNDQVCTINCNTFIGSGINLYINNLGRNNSLLPINISGEGRQIGLITFSNNGVNYNFTSGSVDFFTIGSPIAYAPTSGTGVFNTSVISPTINQTGGANGISRGLYLNPTLTAAADWRAIEVASGGVYVNTTSVQASAILQADSTTKGFLPPRMTTTQKNAIATPAAGLMVYDTTLNKLCVYTTVWETITSL